MNPENARSFLLVSLGICSALIGLGVMVWAFVQQPTCSISGEADFKNLTIPSTITNITVEHLEFKLDTPCTTMAYLIPRIVQNFG